MTNPNDPAYPVTFENGMAEVFTRGLTKREYFAAMAMQGVIFWDATVNERHESGKIEILAHQSVEMADAIIAELKK